MQPFRFQLHQQVHVDCSGERGEVIGRAEYTKGEHQYQVRYKAADGQAVERWWGDSALSAG